jgi:large repetitive protein
MATREMGRAAPLWAVTLLVGTIVVTAMLILGGTARAQPTGSADLSVTKMVKPRVVTVGDNQTFIIKVTNERRDTARDVVMTDPLPDEVRFIRASTSRDKPGSCSARAGTVTCDLGNLRVDRTVTVKIYVKNTEAGRYTNRASVTHSTVELDASDNHDRARARATRG